MNRLASDPRPRAFGEEARWRYCRGAALVGLRRVSEGEKDLRFVLDAEGPQWLHGRAHNELGKIADLAGDRAGALAEYRLANRICRDQRDSSGEDASAALIKTRYQ